MADNLVSLVRQFLTPDLVARIASALGLDRDNVQSAVGAAVPALLAGLGSAAARPGGAQALADAVRQQSDVLDSPAGLIAGSSLSPLLDKGSQMLTSLLGSRDQAVLAGAVGKATGLGQGAGGSLLAMLAPIVMGVIGRQQGGRGIDAGGIASLLSGQKDNIAAALPAGLGNLLGGTGLLDSLGGAARTATAGGGEAARAAASTAYVVGDSGRRAAGAAGAAAAGVPRWLWWAAAVVVAAVLIWLVARPAEQTVQQGAAAVQSLTVGGVDLGKQVTDSIGSLRTTLAGVTDAASAQAALPRLQEITSQIDKVGGMVGQLSAEQRKVLAAIAGPLMPAVNQLFEKVLAMPGVAATLKPTIDGLKQKLAVLTG